MSQTSARSHINQRAGLSDHQLAPTCSCAQLQMPATWGTLHLAVMMKNEFPPLAHSRQCHQARRPTEWPLISNNGSIRFPGAQKQEHRQRVSCALISGRERRKVMMARHENGRRPISIHRRTRTCDVGQCHSTLHKGQLIRALNRFLLPLSHCPGERCSCAPKSVSVKSSRFQAQGQPRPVRDRPRSSVCARLPHLLQALEARRLCQTRAGLWTACLAETNCSIHCAKLRVWSSARVWRQRRIGSSDGGMMASACEAAADCYHLNCQLFVLAKLSARASFVSCVATLACFHD